jgi:putative FmdB family regulatory protein
MPIYEYVCGSCGKTTEVIQKMGSRPPKECPHCGGKLKKAISAPAIQFKGSGFYITDYSRGAGAGDSKSEGGEKAQKSEKSDKSESSGGSEKSEKAERKSESSEKSAKSEKSDKPAKAEKTEKKSTPKS